MALTKITKSGITDSAVERAKIKADAVDATKIADNAISEEHLDPTSIIGNAELAEAANASDILLIYDASAGTLKKILASNVGTQVVTLTSITPTNALGGDGTGNHTFTITGTNLTGASAELINNSGTIVNFDSVTVNSATQITGVIAKSSLPNSGEPYDIRVIGSNGAQATLRNQINVDATPTFVTASGSLGTQLVGGAGSFAVNATDPDSAGNVTFELQSGSLPPGYTITNTAAEGGTAIIAGTDSTTSSTTTFNFVLRAVDAASNTSSRAFSITSRVIISQSFTSSGTFTVPAGTTTLDVLVVAGGGGGGAPAPAPDALHAGGGGAGGLVFFPSYPVTTGTITVTVGNGGPRANANTGNQGSTGSDSAFGSPGDPGLGQGGVLTAKGGGGGGGSRSAAADGGAPGGSGGGGSLSSQNGSTGSGAGATQPTQPGNSGAYGFGTSGGDGSIGGGGAGGGAGQGGFPSQPGPSPAGGGTGKAYTIADGTTPVYYAGGGAGSQNRCGSSTSVFQGGQGGGGDGARPDADRQSGEANKGGGGGGAAEFGVGGDGGKGIVIVRY